MRLLIVLLFFTYVLAEDVTPQLASSLSNSSRVKRSATGSLQIVTNNAQPIHADVRSEGDAPETPCPDSIKPSHIETGVGFKVTPPEESSYATKSLRKSAPLQTMPPTAFDLLRGITRVVTFVIVFISAVCEFYSTFQTLMHTVSNFIGS